MHISNPASNLQLAHIHVKLPSYVQRSLIFRSDPRSYLFFPLCLVPLCKERNDLHEQRNFDSCFRRPDIFQAAATGSFSHRTFQEIYLLRGST